MILFFVLRALFVDYGADYLNALGLLAIAGMLRASRGIWGALVE